MDSDWDMLPTDRTTNTCHPDSYFKIPSSGVPFTRTRSAHLAGAAALQIWGHRKKGDLPVRINAKT